MNGDWGPFYTALNTLSNNQNNMSYALFQKLIGVFDVAFGKGTLNSAQIQAVCSGDSTLIEAQLAVERNSFPKEPKSCPQPLSPWQHGLGGGNGKDRDKDRDGHKRHKRPERKKSHK